MLKKICRYLWNYFIVFLCQYFFWFDFEFLLLLFLSPPYPSYICPLISPYFHPIFHRLSHIFPSISSSIPSEIFIWLLSVLSLFIKIVTLFPGLKNRKPLYSLTDRTYAERSDLPISLSLSLSLSIYLSIYLSLSLCLACLCIFDVCMFVVVVFSPLLSCILWFACWFSFTTWTLDNYREILHIFNLGFYKGNLSLFYPLVALTFHWFAMVLVLKFVINFLHVW